MKRLLARKPSPAMVVAVIALVVAASGTAIAAGKLARGDKLIAKNSLSGNRLRNHTIGTAQVNLARLGTVPSARIASHATSAATATTAAAATNAVHAANATNATNATNAANATNATNATNAANATNALKLGGTPASSFQQRCSPGAVAAAARWFAPSLPTDGTYVSPNRFGGESGFACAGSGLTATSTGAGSFNIKINGLTGNNVFAVVNADAGGGTPLAAYVGGPFAGGIYQVHVASLTGTPPTPTNPSYLTIEFVGAN
jgi:hypothetical protein